MKGIFLFILSLIFFFTPFQKGLFFSEDFYVIGFILSIMMIILVIRLIIYKEIQIIKPVLFVVLLPLCRLLAFFVAESPMGTWNEIIRWISYTSFIIILYWVIQNNGLKKWLPFVFNMTGIVIGLQMIFTHFGWIRDPGAFVANRFAGVFQYPNTFALVMVVFYFFSLINLLRREISKSSFFLFAFSLSLFIFNFIQSYSRGMMLIFPFLWFLGLCFLPFKKQIEYILFTLVSILFPILFYAKFSFARIGILENIITLTVILIVPTLFLFLIRRWVEKKGERLIERISAYKFSRYYFPIIILIMMMALALDLLNHGFIYQSLPKPLQQRIEDISLSASTATERFIFLEDALKMSADSPILGFGGEAWSTVYTNYQQTPYISNKIHNGYAEWLLDMGGIGLFIYLFIFSYLSFNIFQSSRKDKDSLYYLAIFLPLVAIFCHSFIDFNFSYGTIWFIAMWLLAMGIKPKRVSLSEKRIYLKNIPALLFGIMVIIVFLNGIYSYRFMMAKISFDHFEVTNSATEKINSLKRAISYNPYNTDYISELADTYLYVWENQNIDHLSKEVENLAHQLVLLEPKNPSILNTAAIIYLRLGDWEKAADYFDTAITMDRYNKTLYKNSLKLKAEKIDEFLKSNPLIAKNVAQSITDVFKEMEHWETEFKKRNLGEAFNSKDFRITNEIKYYGSYASFILGDYKEVLRIYDGYLPDTQNDSYNQWINALTFMSLKQLNYEEQAQIIFERNKTEKFVDICKKLGEIVD